MWLKYLQYIIISLIIIFISHNLFKFFKDNLTSPKTKDFIKKPIHQYDQVFKQ